MKLLILGKHADDRGTQLEVLTKELLDSMHYRNLVLNVATDAGEVDVQGEFILPGPGADRIYKLIGECKAHGDPLNMTDWLKFLGKLWVAEAGGDDVTACLIALSGVNGNVTGSFESLTLKNVQNIQLVSSDRLVQFLRKTHGLTEPQLVVSYVNGFGLTYSSISLAYYERRVYWVVEFDTAAFTVLAADGKYPPEEKLAEVRPLLQDKLKAATFVDLRQEEAERFRKLMARKIVIGAAMLNNGKTNLPGMQKLLTQNDLRPPLPADALLGATAELVARKFIKPLPNEEWEFTEEITTDLDLRRGLFTEFLQEVALTEALGCDWMDKYVDIRLLEYICQNLQSGLKLPEKDQRTTIRLMQLSPSALAYALTPDPMITTHRIMSAVPLTPDVEEFDRSHFLRMLYGHLYTNFRTSAFGKYFHAHRRVEAFVRSVDVAILDREGNILLADRVSDSSMIGEWHEKSPDGSSVYIQVATLPEFLKQKNEAAKKKRDELAATVGTELSAARNDKRPGDEPERPGAYNEESS